eukprot:5932717-Prymnesium_polylepis.2
MLGKRLVVAANVGQHAHLGGGAQRREHVVQCRRPALGVDYNANDVQQGRRVDRGHVGADPLEAGPTRCALGRAVRDHHFGARRTPAEGATDIARLVPVPRQQCARRPRQPPPRRVAQRAVAVSYTHLRAHETLMNL